MKINGQLLSVKTEIREKTRIENSIDVRVDITDNTEFLIKCETGRLTRWSKETFKK